jgi:hypothetical protein
MSKIDLKKANIMWANNVVILSSQAAEIRNLSNNKTENNEQEDKNQKNTVILTREDEDLLDAKTIFKYKAVRELRPDIPVVTDLVNAQNLAFLLSSPYEYSLMKKHNFTETPVFA